jgi:CRP-like cAMP-binding protein
MFLRMIERRTGCDRQAHIDVPMTRSDVANYLGLSLEAVSRACRTLERNGILAFPSRHDVCILDRPRFEKLAAAL